ncbi:MAG: type IX secretion system sortase PorU [Rhodothermales bacterium]|nr:type IX secretion system sortase PorU [Rhodothermales bacterium]MBO6780588.1 type IX secretion system sortase PorU [Rhodothermales bacterium]
MPASVIATNQQPIARTDTNFGSPGLRKPAELRLDLNLPIRLVLRTAVFFLVALWAMAPIPAQAQQASSEVVWLSDSELEVRFSMTWPRTLRETVDSLEVQVMGRHDLARIAGGMLEVTELVDLPSLTPPSVRVTGAGFDEIRLPAGPEALAGPSTEARVEAPGMYRKRAVASVIGPAATYDPGTGTVRRYHSLAIRVTGVQQPSARVTGGISNPHLQITRSVLADGTVYRIPITEEGIYRIDRALLSAIGLNPDQIEPNNLQIFGNGGAPVPALNSDPRIADLAENPVLVRGGGDGRFDSGDVLLFYAAGPISWSWDASGWQHTVHPYSVENAYFLKVGSGPGARISTAPFVSAGNMPVLSSVTGRHVVDFEEQIWSRDHESGSDWMSNAIRAQGTRRLLDNVTPPGLQAGEVVYRARSAIASNPRAMLNYESGGQVIAQQLAPSIIVDRSEQPAASPATTTFTHSLSAGRALDLTVRLLDQINEPQAAIDYVQAFYPQALDGSTGYLRVAAPDDVTGPHVLEFSGFSGRPFIWDVTDPRLIRELGQEDFVGVNHVRIDRSEGERPRELVAFVESAARPLQAELIAGVPNQNLHGLTGFPGLAIVTPPEFLEAAEELAEMRRADGLEVVVAQTAHIYNEFSGGIPDMRAVRDYFRFLYDRGPTEDQTLRYGLLFGDGHYDFRGLATREGSLENWVFPFETEESLNTDATYSSDDYFGLLSPNEGIWRYTTYFASSFERVDIGVGRLPAQSLAEARMLVDKIRRYESPETFGSWRTEYVFVADDGPTGQTGQQDDADLHVQNVDQVAELIRGGLYPEINVRKVYAESFDRVFLNGFRIPDAKEEINAALNRGTLLFNYSGHGGPEGLAQEEIFTKEDAIALTNKDKLAVFVTATCSFGWWDLQNDQSGAEALLLNPEGGAVALLTTVRLVYTSGDTTSLNAGLNRALNIELFREAEDGLPRRLGDALQLTKNTPVGLQGNSRKFNLLGDPSMRLGLPTRQVAVERLNGTELATTDGRLRALDRVTVEGSVLDAFGAPDPTFDGLVQVTVFDAERNVPLVKQRRMPRPYYEIREDLIWRGQVTATQGRWSATFVVPKDISYSNLAGRISTYARSATEHGIGFTERLLVGGTSDNPPNDAAGPSMRLFLNDTTFTAGSTTPADTELIVRLYDESGINTVGAGVGHEVLLVVNGDESGAEDISAAFESAPDSYQEGEIRWPLELEGEGPGRLSVRAWDVLNNSATAELDFVVRQDEVLRLANVYNYPNPMSRRTRFVFEHNQAPGTPARVRVRIFTLNGTPIKTIAEETALPGGVLNSGPVQILWDGMDDDLDRIATGIYLYQLRVEVDQPDGTTQTSEVVEKLAVIR